jgi:hypothetical protein
VTTIREAVHVLHPHLEEKWDDVDFVWDVKDAPDGRRIAVMPLLFTAAVIIGPRHNVLNPYDDRWCYHSIEAALAAVWAWDGTGEPDGWHRHPDSGRRRPGGDPHHEYINL